MQQQQRGSGGDPSPCVVMGREILEAQGGEQGGREERCHSGAGPYRSRKKAARRCLGAPHTAQAFVMDSFAAAVSPCNDSPAGARKACCNPCRSTHPRSPGPARQARPVRRPDSRRPLPQKCCPFQIPFSLSLLYRPPSPHIRSLTHTSTGTDPVVDAPPPATSRAGPRQRQLRHRQQRDPATLIIRQSHRQTAALHTAARLSTQQQHLRLIIQSVIDSRSPQAADRRVAGSFATCPDLSQQAHLHLKRVLAVFPVPGYGAPYYTLIGALLAHFNLSILHGTGFCTPGQRASR